jgi:hypothetical protein
MKIARTVFVIGILITLFIFADCIRDLYSEVLTIRIEQENYKDIPSPAQIQQLLNLLEPEKPIKVDGKIGIATIAKWERVYCNQCAKNTFNHE